MTICATILTGNRPALLAATLASSRAELLKCGRVIVLHNGGDAETTKVLDECGIDHDRIVRDGTMIPNGPATSVLAGHAKASGCPLWWHLEDDWEQVPGLVARHPTWFEDAQEIASNPAIGQVRLREESHLGRLLTLPDGLRGDGSGAANTNWVDARPVAWQVQEGTPFMVANAHWTQNPFICRAEIASVLAPEKPGEYIRGVYPAEDERHAQARFYGLNLLVAQLRPGVFRHIGDEHSLEGHRW